MALKAVEGSLWVGLGYDWVSMRGAGRSEGSEEIWLERWVGRDGS